jgi:hypothetical protein
VGRMRTLIGRNDMSRLELPSEENGFRFRFTEEDGETCFIYGLAHVTVMAREQLMYPFLPLTIDGK